LHKVPLCGVAVALGRCGLPHLGSGSLDCGSRCAGLRGACVVPEDAVPEKSMPAEAVSDEQVPVLPRRLRGFRQERRPGSPREVVHKVKVTPEQEQRLAARAEERGITVSRLLVESALAGGSEAAKTKAVLAGELFGISRLLGRLGVNVNQIARATNATRRVQPETAAALEATVRVCHRIEGFLDDVDGLRRPAGQGGSGGAA